MRKKLSLFLAVIFVFTSVLYYTAFAKLGVVKADSLRRAIIVLPGIMGSNLEETDGTVVWVTNKWIDGSKQLYYFLNGTLDCTSDGFSEKAIEPVTGGEEYGAEDTYKKLVTSLKAEFGNSYDIVFGAYDWRLDNTYSAKQLKKIIDKYDKVSIVAHSMGGLVVSKYISLYGGNKLDKVITLGTPYWGALNAASTLHTGQVDEFPAGIKQLMSGTMRSTLLNYPGLNELLPDENYTEKSNWLVTSERKYDNWYDYIWPDYYDKLNDAEDTEAFMENDFNSKLVEQADSFHKSIEDTITPIKTVNYTAIVGTGIDTLKTVKLVDTSIAGIETRLSIPEEYSSGDGTVPLLSSTMGEDINYIERPGVSHADLVNDDATISLVVENLKGIKANNALKSQSSAFTKTNADMNKLVFVGDLDFDAIKDNKVKYHIHSEKDIESGKDFNITNIGNVNGQNVFFISYKNDGYSLKLTSKKAQNITFAYGTSSKRFAFKNIKLGNKASVYIMNKFSNKNDVFIDYNDSGMKNSISTSDIKEISK
ncbi:lecithin--cholesterol acyltransferase [Clostridium sp. 19966]|uniref:lipase family alpha/beta hydrolase n=1 Tax=Clostridium sp. 19966 TaxID=2768166 RepID=UPI0028DE38E2|nr:lecithin--cholesterol acyltransferase [Clostridium sp. 19966]MDT8717811.1 lecithin--cholesterol acyltransferase [Clostridium sp. 19966]